MARFIQALLSCDTARRPEITSKAPMLFHGEKFKLVKTGHDDQVLVQVKAKGHAKLTEDVVPLLSACKLFDT